MTTIFAKIALCALLLAAAGPGYAAEDAHQLLRQANRALNAIEHHEKKVVQQTTQVEQQREPLFFACLTRERRLLRDYRQLAERWRQRLLEALLNGNRQLQREATQQIALLSRQSPSWTEVQQRCSWMRGLRSDGRSFVEIEVDEAIKHQRDP